MIIDDDHPFDFSFLISDFSFLISDYRDANAEKNAGLTHAEVSTSTCMFKGLYLFTVDMCVTIE